MTGIVLLSLRILSGLALYVFLGGALYLLWRSLQNDALKLSTRQVIPINILVSTPGEADRLFQFSQSNVAIGRDPDCDCVLPHGTVSARHARLSFHHAQWWVDDLLSTNGTLLNNEPLHMPTVVANGDTIRCGQIILTIALKTEIHPLTGE